jgi:hypothetical protein
LRELAVSYAVWKTIVDANKLSEHHMWVGGARTLAGHESVLAFSGNREFVYTTTPEGSDEADWLANYKPDSAEQVTKDDILALLLGDPTVSRHAKDGSIVVKLDSGDEDDDPSMYEGSKAASVSPDTDDIVWNEGGGKVYGMIAQVKDAQPGDTIEAIVGVAMADTVPNPAYPGEEPEFLPVDTILPGGFGKMNAPMPASDQGWGERSIVFGTSKEIPAFAKLGICLKTTADTGDRTMLCDFMRQIPEGS